MPTRLVFAPLLAVGGASLLWQVAAARSILAALHGNELVLGLVLATWLLLLGAGSALGALLGRSDPPRDAEPASGPTARTLTALLLLCPVAILASLAAQQALLPALAATGQVTSPARALCAAALCLALPCLLLGASFAVAARLTAHRGWSERAAIVYSLESLGTVAAGVVFHFALAAASLRAVALVAASLPWLAGIMSPAIPAARAAPRGRRRLTALALLGLAALVYLAPGVRLPGSSLLAPRAPGYELLEARNSPHAALAVLRRGDQILFQANGETVFSNQDEQQIEPEVHLPLLAHAAPRRVLLIGGGLGGGLREALQHPVERLDYVELDPALLQLARRFGDRRQWAPLDDRRVRSMIGDGRRVVAESVDVYDVILVGLPGPSSALINRFYTEEFFASARRALRAGGLLRLTVEGNEGYLTDELALVQATVIAALRRVFGNALALPAQSTLLLAGRDGPIPLGPPTLQRRWRERKITTALFSESELVDRTLPFTRELHAERLAQVRPLRNTDLEPGAYLHASLLWLATSSPALSRGLLRLAESSARWRWPVTAAALLAALAAAALVRRRRPAALPLAIVGGCALAIELCLLLGCQETRGVVYHEIGALLTAFMLGLAIGAPLGRVLAARWPRGALAAATAAVGVVALASVGVLRLAQLAPLAALPLLLAAIALLGLAVGACYPPAVATLAERCGEGAIARSYLWDLLGAAAGSLLAAGVALPLLGIGGTCLLCAALCVGCAAGAWR